MKVRWVSMKINTWTCWLRPRAASLTPPADASATRSGRRVNKVPRPIQKSPIFVRFRAFRCVKVIVDPRKRQRPLESHVYVCLWNPTRANKPAPFPQSPVNSLISIWHSSPFLERLYVCVCLTANHLVCLVCVEALWKKVWSFQERS